MPSASRPPRRATRRSPAGLLAPLIGARGRVLRWDRFPRPVGILMLMGIRARLRRRNLFDTGVPAPDATLLDQVADPAESSRRTVDGTLNDLASPRMGGAGVRFGRNVPPQHTFPEARPAILEPNPRRVSRELLTRTRFLPATTLNVLAAAWLQFEVHDWFSHGKNEQLDPWELPLERDDGWPERPMRIPRTKADPNRRRDPRSAPTFVTADSHWWDGSQVYGTKKELADDLRTWEDGKLRLENGLPPRALDEHMDLEGPEGNLWVGLGLLHVLFMREHNAICDRLRREHPTWTDDRLYDKARLINAALMAKIHTVEWTPAVIAHPTTRYAMRATWRGIAGERVRPWLGPLRRNQTLCGIPGSRTDHYGVPYSLTEEFVAVYRMHPLLPDEFTFRAVETGQLLQELPFPELGALQTRRRLEELGAANALYSLGIAHAGEISLHNYPRFLQSLERPRVLLDLAATDILRSRERGVPRYNDFRRLLRLRPAGSFEGLTGNARAAREIRRVYAGNIEQVDLMIGLYAEPKPRGFAFSDTAFRVFILMATRRLKSDRFFTRDYTARMYTQTGLDWINESSMVTVLLRHFPELAPALAGRENAFAPWARVR